MNISSGRRKIIYWITGALSGLMFWKLLPGDRKKEEPMKMLTEDGQLVEVDVKHLTGQRQKLKTKEIQGWVKRKG
jgi:hypothetical protein